YRRLARSANPAIREHALVLALVFGDPQALADLRHTAITETVPITERLAALEVLIDQHVADLAPVLLNLLSDGRMRRTAFPGLAAYADAATPRQVLARYPELTAEEKQDAVAALATRKEYARALLDAVASNIVPRSDISAYAARQLHSLGDQQVSEQLRR